MNFKCERDYVIVSTSICDINNHEMSQMCQMRDKVKKILENHRDEKAKKEYISDKELEKIYAILLTFTGDWEVEKSKFDEVYKELQETPITDWDDEAIKEQTSK